MGSIEIKTFHKIVLSELKMICKVCLYISYFYLYMFYKSIFFRSSDSFTNSLHKLFKINLSIFIDISRRKDLV